MKAMKSLLFIAALHATTGIAAPVYLECTLSDNKHPETKVQASVSLDEATQSVGYSIATTGLTQKLPAIFSADQLLFVSGPGTSTETQYTISRNDLTIKSFIPGMAKLLDDPNFGQSGACSIVKVSPGRKF
jgi:hypothetical protein